jgi:hypothetical protein
MQHTEQSNFSRKPKIFAGKAIPYDDPKRFGEALARKHLLIVKEVFQETGKIRQTKDNQPQSANEHITPKER